MELHLDNGDWRTGDARCRIPQGCWPAAPGARAPGPCRSRARAVLMRACRTPARRGGWPVTTGCGAAEPRRAVGAKARPRGAPTGVAAHPEQASPSRGPPESRGRRRRSVGRMREIAARPRQMRLAEAQTGSGLWPTEERAAGGGTTQPHAEAQAVGDSGLATCGTG